MTDLELINRRGVVAMMLLSAADADGDEGDDLRAIAIAELIAHANGQSYPAGELIEIIGTLMHISYATSTDHSRERRHRLAINLAIETPSSPPA